MKRQHRLFTLTALALLLAAGCDLLFGRSADSTISQFESIINSSDRSSLYTLLDPNSGKYTGAKTPSFWDAEFPTSDSYTFSVSVSDTYASGTVVSTTFGSRNISFVLTKSGMDTVISSITVGGTVIFN